MKLSTPKWLICEETQAMLRAFGDIDIKFVGGAVRDCLLGIEAKDIDLATPLPPEQVMQLLQRAGIKAIPTGIDHGTITAVVGKRSFEITTLRRDISTDGRRATVTYTDDWREDAMRRDFTINALYCDAQGEVSDYFNGIADLQNGHICFIGNAQQRIHEDALRILRFFRFFAYYGKGIPDKRGLSACGELAEKIDRLSGERIQQEMLKLLIAPENTQAITFMQDNGILRYVIPQPVSVKPLQLLSALMQKTGRAFDPILALASLVRSTQGDHAMLAGQLSARWKLSKRQQLLLSDLCGNAITVYPGNQSEQQKHIRALGKELFIQHCLLSAAEGTDEQSTLQAIAIAESWEVPQFPLTGDDLIRHGVEPGKTMGAMLKKLEALWEEESYCLSKAELLRYSETIKL